jgi:proteasome lid subunit RPN8/RPN11
MQGTDQVDSSHLPETSNSTARCAEGWVLVGQRRGGIWLGKMLDRAVGRPELVEFDGVAALAREESRGDVIGFLHTHPACEATPSRRDVDTMQAWTSALGKPLLCVIVDTDGLHAHRFDDDTSEGIQLAQVEQFENDFIVAIDHFLHPNS